MAAAGGGHVGGRESRRLVPRSRCRSAGRPTAADQPAGRRRDLNMPRRAARGACYVARAGRRQAGDEAGAELAGKGAARVWSRGFGPKAATPPGPPDRLLEPSWF